ncbi:MAG: hypothetical protein V4616_07255 [Bacteroidota bacterium]
MENFTCKQKSSFRFSFLSLLQLLVLLISGSSLYAEGSRELAAGFGNRIYLNAGSTVTASNPFPTPGIFKVFARAGESIYVGSSAQGIGNGTMILRSPNGNTYTSGSGTLGKIENKLQEALGPQLGYQPFVQPVGAGEEGIWEVSFIAPNAAATSDPTNPVLLDAWTQENSYWIAAFDISVKVPSALPFTNGRMYANVFNAIMGGATLPFTGTFRVLTPDGYVYNWALNTISGLNFCFFANSKGIRNGFGDPSYLSNNAIFTSPDVHDPRTADVANDITHKIFFNDPAADLPGTTVIAGGGTTWLRNSPLVPTIADYTFTGMEGTRNIMGTTPLGGHFAFTANLYGKYTIQIDINRNGNYTDPIDRIMTGITMFGANKIYWDGKDGLGNAVAASTTPVTAIVSNTLFSGEIHFPLFDVENNPNGMVITRASGPGSPTDVVHWDDTFLSGTGTAAMATAGPTTTVTTNPSIPGLTCSPHHSVHRSQFWLDRLILRWLVWMQLLRSCVPETR